MLTYYNRLGPQERRTIRKQMMFISMRRTSQLQDLDKALIEPVKSVIRAEKEVLHNTMSIQEYIDLNTKVSKQIKGFFKNKEETP